MSYTLTIEEPETKALLERETANVSPAELSALFAMFLVQRHKHEVARRGASRRRRTGGRLSVGHEKTGAEFVKLWGRMGLKDGELDLTRSKEPMREVDFS